MVRSPCCDNMGLKKGPWTPDEDRILLAYIQEHGHGSWRSLPSKAGLQRCGKSCRLRWTNYLRPDIKRGKFSLQEEQTIIQLHALLGNRWSAIATHLPKRTDNEIKNYWNTHLKKRLSKMGIDPITHKPKDVALNSFQSKDLANISHMAQWESARLQAEARLVRESKLVSGHYHLLNSSAAAVPPPPLPLAPLPRPPCLDILKVWEWTNPGRDISSMILNCFSASSGGSEIGLFNGGSCITVLNSVGNTCAYVDDSLGFPSFINGFSDDLPPGIVSAAGTGVSYNALGGCWEVVEENKNSWSNILIAPTSPMDSPMI